MKSKWAIKKKYPKGVSPRMKRSHNTDGTKTQNDKRAHKKIGQPNKRLLLINKSSYAIPVSLESSLDKGTINAVDGVIDFRNV